MESSLKRELVYLRGSAAMLENYLRLLSEQEWEQAVSATSSLTLLEEALTRVKNLHGTLERMWAEQYQCTMERSQ